MEDMQNQTNASEQASDEKTNAAKSLLDAIQTMVASFTKKEKQEKSDERINEMFHHLVEIKETLQEQENFNKKLYSKLLEAQDDNVRRDMLISIIKIHEMLDEQIYWIKYKLPDQSKGDFQEQVNLITSQILYVRNRVSEILTQTYNLEEVIPEEGQKVNPKVCKIVASHITDDSAKHLTISDVITSGFINPVKNIILRPANVETWRLEQANGLREKNNGKSEDEHTYNN